MMLFNAFKINVLALKSIASHFPKAYFYNYQNDVLADMQTKGTK